MNLEIEPVHVGGEEDVDVGSVENFEHEEIDYAIFRLESGFFATQGHCYCEDQTFLSESSVEGEELECASCGNTFSIVSGDCLLYTSPSPRDGLLSRMPSSA